MSIEDKQVKVDSDFSKPGVLQFPVLDTKPGERSTPVKEPLIPGEIVLSTEERIEIFNRAFPKFKDMTLEQRHNHIQMLKKAILIGRAELSAAERAQEDELENLSDSERKSFRKKSKEESQKIISTIDERREAVAAKDKAAAQIAKSLGISLEEFKKKFPGA